jgi:Trk K+ transport system NAD-binding subunit
MPGCSAVGKTLRELNLLEKYGVTPLFLWKSGTFIAEPEAGITVNDATSLFLFGPADSMATAIRNNFCVDGNDGSFAIIAGYGDVGKAAYQDLRSAGITCRIVDSKSQDMDQVVGNAEDEQVLKESDIGHAKFCIVALNDDSVNIFTTLMARNLNPAIRILARANEPSSVDKLYRAGADYVALLPTIGGQTVGRIVLSDSVTILIDLPDEKMVVMKQIRKKHPGCSGQYAKKTGVRIIGIESANRSVVTPDASEILLEGDAVIAVGTTEQLKKFIRLL